jgi:hypothetical protein
MLLGVVNILQFLITLAFSIYTLTGLNRWAKKSFNVRVS